MQTKKLLIPLLLAVCVCAVPLLLLFSEYLEKWELGVYDILCDYLVEKEKTSEQVSLIAIDTESLEWGYRYFEKNEDFVGEGILEAASEDGKNSVDFKDFIWPWKRSVYERIINFLAEGGARVIAFDMVFDTPHNSGDWNDEESLGYISLLLNEEGRTYVIHTINFHATESPPKDHLTEKQKTCLEKASIQVEGIDGSTLPFNRSDKGIYYGPILPYKAIVVDGMEDFLRLGAVTVQPDIDAVIRRARVLIRYDRWTFPALGLAAALAYWESRDGPGAVILKVGDTELIIDNNAGKTSTSIPLTPSGDILVHYKDSGKEGYEGEGRFKTYPAFRILLSAMDNPELLAQFVMEPEKFKLDPSEFKDKIVIIGATALGLFDLKATPITEKYPGFKVHASVAENLLEGESIRRLPLTGRFLIALVMTLITILSTLNVKKTVLKFLIAAGATALYCLAAAWLFTHDLLWIDTIIPLAGVLIAYTSGTTYNYFTEGRQKRKITRMFQHYVPAKVVDKIVANPEGLNTRGERVDITVFFSDIKGFTSISNTSKMRDNPGILTDHLNAYLTEMTGAIHDCGGTLDKYIGDAVVAFFGAPLPMENHAREACRAALECQHRLEVFNAKASEADLPELLTRIGLYTGEAMVGNVGSEVRLSYTAIGSTVNFGSRLEGVNKAYGTWILAGEPTIRKAGDSITARFLDPVRVPGVVEGAPPLKVYQVLSMAKEATEKDRQMLALFDRAMAEYKPGRFEKALPLFEQCAKEFNDPPSEVFAKRCKSLMEKPPVDWDGVWRIESK